MRWIVFAALLAVSCASERALSVGDTTWKEIRINGETISARVTITEIAEYDSLGNLIHRAKRHAESLHEESWYEYDVFGRKIRLRNNSGYEERYDYDANGREIRMRSSNGREERYEYDANGRKIRSRSETGYERRYEYDANGNMVHATGVSSDSMTLAAEEWYEYDANGKLSYLKRISKHFLLERRRHYDDKGNVIYEKTHTVDPHLYPDDYPAGVTYETWIEYDEKRQPIHLKTSDGLEEWFEYDDKGNLICRRWPSGTLDWTDYTFWQNGKVKTSIEYLYIPSDSLRH